MDHETGVRARLRHDLPYLACLLAAFVAVLIAVHPFREVLHEDDFSWAYQVKQLTSGGGFAIGSWGGSTQVFPILWGALFCLPFGFSFSALIASTLPLVFAGLVALYFLLGEFIPSRAARAAAALAAIANPVSLDFTCSFMTEMPFASLMTIALALLARYISGGFCSRPLLVAGSFAGAVAILVRQFGIVVGMALVAVLAWRSFRTRRWRIADLGIAAAFPAAALALWLAAAAMSDPLSLGWALDTLKTRKIETHSFYPVVSMNAPGRFFFLTVYPVFFLLPFVAAALASAGRRLPALARRALVLSAVAALGLVACFVLSDKQGPSLSEGLSPRDVDPRAYLGSALFWHLGMALSVLTIALAFGLALSRPSPSPATLFLALSVAFSYALAFLSPFWFTTYAVPLNVVPLLALALAALGRHDVPRGLPFFLAPAVAAALAFSASLARARLDLQEGIWQETEKLVAEGIPAEAVAANSLAWVGWHHYPRAKEKADPSRWVPRGQIRYLVLANSADAWGIADFEEISTRRIDHIGWKAETIHVYRRRQG